jgi:hypothetical protein
LRSGDNGYNLPSPLAGIDVEGDLLRAVVEGRTGLTLEELKVSLKL